MPDASRDVPQEEGQETEGEMRIREVVNLYSLMMSYRSSNSFSKVLWASGCLFFSSPKIMSIA
jgi:hypothetical protein